MNTNLIYGKLPPQAKELESATLGAILIDKFAYDKITDIIQPECLYVEANQIVFKACQSLAKRNQPIDLLTVIEELRRSGQVEAVGGIHYVTQLTNVDARMVVNIESYCRIIHQKFIQRELIRVSSEILTTAYEDSADAFDLLDDAENKILQIASSHLNSDYTNLQAGMTPVMEKIEKLRLNDSHITGIPTGFKQLDNITHGWQAPDLIILAARPSTGKTAFALNLARNAAKLATEFKTGNVGFFSLEMSTGQLIQRLLSRESELPLDSILSGQLYEGSLKRLYRTVEHDLGSVKMFIDDTAALSIQQLRSKARRMVTKDNVGLIIIDYLQLMSGDSNKSDNREREISKISRELKKLAKELNVPVIALSQLSRQVETRADPIPKLSDLRESGAIEQDADIVMFIHKPSQAAMDLDAGLKEVRYLSIAKNRNGALGEVLFRAYDYIMKWVDGDAPPVNFKPVHDENAPF